MHARVTGSYLRGRRTCGDIDFIISPGPATAQLLGLGLLMQGILTRLQAQGCITEVCAGFTLYAVQYGVRTRPFAVMLSSHEAAWMVCCDILFRMRWMLPRYVNHQGHCMPLAGTAHWYLSSDLAVGQSRCLYSCQLIKHW